jgi:hypothetical protein
MRRLGALLVLQAQCLSLLVSLPHQVPLQKHGFLKSNHVRFKHDLIWSFIADGADGVTYEVRSEEPLARRSQASPSDDEDLSEDEWTETEASGSSDDSDSFDDSDSDLLASDDSGGDEPIRRRAANMDGVDGRVVVVEEDAGEGEHRR